MIKLNPNDVILGRGGYNYKYPGNKAFKELVKAFASNYAEASKSIKSELSAQMVAIVMDANPPGRFLRKHRNGYEEVEYAVAREKASQSLRDAVMELKNTPTSSYPVDGTTTPGVGELNEKENSSPKFEPNKRSLTPAPSQYKMKGGDEENKKENMAHLIPIQEKAASWKKDDFNPPHHCIVQRNEAFVNNQRFFPSTTIKSSTHPLLPNAASENMNSSRYQPTLLLSYNEPYPYQQWYHPHIINNQVLDDCSASASSNTTTAVCGPYHSERRMMIPPPAPQPRKRIKRTSPDYIQPLHCFHQPQPENFTPPSMNPSQQIHQSHDYCSSLVNKSKFIKRFASLGSTNTTTTTTTCDSSMMDAELDLAAVSSSVNSIEGTKETNKTYLSSSLPTSHHYQEPNFFFNSTSKEYNNFLSEDLTKKNSDDAWQNDHHLVVTSSADKAVPALKRRSHWVDPSSSSAWPQPPTTPDFFSVNTAAITTQVHAPSTSFVTDPKKSIFIKRHSALRSTFKSPNKDLSMDDLVLSPREDLDLRLCMSTSKSIDSIDSFHEPL